MTSDAELLARIEADADEIKGGPYDAAPMRALYAAAANRRAAEDAVTAAVGEQRRERLAGSAGEADGGQAHEGGDGAGGHGTHERGA